MNVLVIGAGMMGSAIAFDLSKSDFIQQVILADLDLNRATFAARQISEKVIPLELDANNFESVVDLMRNSHLAISAVSYTYNLSLTKAAIEASIHFLDLGGNHDVVKKQLQLNQQAREKNICILPNCGLAPGLANILAMGGIREFDMLDEIQIRVGGLPQNPVPPLNYQLTFSAEGLVNEYIEPVEVIRNGHIMLVNPMEDLEDISFNSGYAELEAFNTSGGISTMCHYLQGKVNKMDYKTIRYKGHCEKIKMLIDLGFISNEALIFGSTIKTAKEFFIEMIEKKLNLKGEDVVLLRVNITGKNNGVGKKLVYEMIDFYDPEDRISAMMRTTAFPTSIIAEMILKSNIKSVGVMPPEVCVPAIPLIGELQKRNIIITKNIF